MQTNDNLKNKCEVKRGLFARKHKLFNYLKTKGLTLVIILHTITERAKTMHLGLVLQDVHNLKETLNSKT